MFDGENPKSVFEIGCANGGFLESLREKYPGIQVGGLDINKEDIQKVQKTFPDSNFFVHDVRELLPLADKSVDIIFSVGVLMYILDPYPVLKEMFRVAKKVIIAEFHHDTLDQFGTLTKGYRENGKTQISIVRNYIDLFNEVKPRVPIGIMYASGGKTILKCET